MRFPKQRIRYSNSVDGHVEKNGFLVLDIKGLDIEGATTLVLDMSDVDAARASGDKASEATKQARELLGG
jgi:hypothetical protein